MNLAGLAIFLLAGLALTYLGAVLATARLMSRPPRRTYAAAVAANLPGDPSELPTPRPFSAWTFAPGRALATPAWTIQGDDPAGPLLVFCHGWGESRHAILPRLHALAPHCSTLVAWDLPGHGESPPARSPLGTTEHHLLAELLAAVQTTPPRPVVLHGFSLGAGIALRHAADHPGAVAAVIAEAPYRLPQTPPRYVLHHRGLPHRLTLRPAVWLSGLGLPTGPNWRGFDRAAHAARLTAPLLVLHGTADPVSPFADGQAIAAAAPHATLAPIESARHNDLWTTHAQASTAAVRAFLAPLQAQLPAPTPAPIRTH